MTSADAGCRGCRFLHILLECALRAYHVAGFDGDPILQWIGPVCLLQLTRKDVVQRFQFFYPKSMFIWNYHRSPLTDFAQDHAFEFKASYLQMSWLGTQAQVSRSNGHTSALASAKPCIKLVALGGMSNYLRGFFTQRSLKMERSK